MAKDFDDFDAAAKIKQSIDEMTAKQVTPLSAPPSVVDLQKKELDEIQSRVDAAKEQDDLDKALLIQKELEAAQARLAGSRAPPPISAMKRGSRPPGSSTANAEPKSKKAKSASKAPSKSKAKANAKAAAHA